jgi:hypothetical protein
VLSMGNFQKQTFIECDRPDKRRVSYESRRPWFWFILRLSLPSDQINLYLIESSMDLNSYVFVIDMSRSSLCFAL